MKILITGGAGYIGSHTLIELVNAGYSPIVIDNFENSSPTVFQRIKQITGCDIPFLNLDVRDKCSLREVFSQNPEINAVIHFAGSKSVGESVEDPLKYFDNNVNGLVSLCQVMKEFNCKTLVFSSSATVYGNPKSVPIKEQSPLSITNPYGRSKLICEEILQDLFNSDNHWKISILRYFNPVGAHPCGLIGEDPKGVPNNLMPYIAQVAVGKRRKLNVYGGDYLTRDGTGIRDYIHVVDLASAHVAALKNSERGQSQVVRLNIGTGVGYSVLEMIVAFEKVSGVKIPYIIVGRREGDIAECYSDSKLAEKIIGWKSELGLERMCIDLWRWQSNNPLGLIKIKE